MVPLTLLNLLIAYLAGVLTFFAGCLAPVAPVYVSFLAGVAPDKIDAKHKKVFLKNSLLFTGGFLFVFLLLGLTLNTFARVLGSYRPFLNKIAGIFLIIFGLFLGKFVNVPLLNKTFSFQRKGPAPNVAAGEVGAFGLGATFGFAWTPCVGPVLAAILFWVSSQNSLAAGLPLLVLFAIGLGTPFILIGLAFDKFWPVFRKLNKYSLLLNKVAGILLIIFGVLIFTNNFSVISAYLLERLGSFAFSLELIQ
jgi:cytochrome c-type biogenesis protein